MTSIAYPYTFVPNTTIFSSQVNADFTAVSTVVNGNIDNTNIAPAAGINITKLGLNPGGVAFNQSTTGANTWASGLTTDSVPRVTLTTDKGLRFGPGGAGALDLELVRSAASTLQLNNAAGGAATLDLDSGVIENVLTLGVTGTSTLATLAGVTAFTGSVLPWSIAKGGTGQTTQQTALNALAPAAPTSGQLLGYNGANWVSVNLGVRFTGVAQALAINADISSAHGLGLVPALIWCQFKCTTANNGYSIGDLVAMYAGSGSAVGSTSITLFADATNVHLYTGTAFLMVPKAGGTPAAITVADWSVILYAQP